MDSSYFTKPLIFLIQILFGSYGLLVLLRFLLQLVRADFYNPISQFIAKVTILPLRYLRRLIPGVAGLDLALLLFALLLKTLELLLIKLLSGDAVTLVGAMLWAIPELIELLLNIFLVAILIQVVFSWFGPQSGYHPAANLAYSLSEPLLEPMRRLIPPMSGLDFSPMLATVIIVLLKMILLPPLKMLTGSPF